MRFAEANATVKNLTNATNATAAVTPKNMTTNATNAPVVVVVQNATNATNATRKAPVVVVQNATKPNATKPNAINATRPVLAEQPVPKPQNATKPKRVAVKKKAKNRPRVMGAPKNVKVECNVGLPTARFPGDGGIVENVFDGVGFMLCKEYCKEDDAEGPVKNPCSVDGEIFRPPQVEGAGSKVSKSPVPITGTGTDKDLLPDTPPSEQVRSFWTEEGAKSTIVEDGKPRLPHPRKGHTTSIVGNDMFVFGGCNAPVGKCWDRLLKLDLATMTWSYPKIGGAAPPALSGHTANVVRLPPKADWGKTDAEATVPYIFILGGKSSIETQDGPEVKYSNTLYILGVEASKTTGIPALTWTKVDADQMHGPGMKSELHPHGWSPRQGHTATRVGSYLYVFGGDSDDGLIRGDRIMRMKVLPDQEQFVLNQKLKYTWTILDALKGAAPAARHGHSAAFLSGRYYTLFGGFAGSKATNEVFVLDLGAAGEKIGDNCKDTTGVEGDECKWVQPTTTGSEPLPRQYAATAVLGKRGSRGNNKLAVFGGCGYPSKVCFNDAFVLRVTKEGWVWQGTDVDDDQIPERREQTTMTYIPSTVHFTSLTNAFGPHVKMAKDGAKPRMPMGPTTTGAKHGASLLEIEGNSSELNTSIVGRKHGKRVIIFGGVLREAKSFNDLFTFEMGQHRPEALPDLHSDLPLTPAELGCKQNCSGHGRCDVGRCVCMNETYGAWTGANCSIPPKKPVVAGFTLPADSIIVSLIGRGCKNNCSNHGECRNGTCVCHANVFGHWQGPLCDRLRCPNDCSGNGVCHNGTCACDKTYGGDACELRVCAPFNTSRGVCSGHGVCHEGACGCKRGWEGEACDIKNMEGPCGKLNCSYPNGRCINDTTVYPAAVRCQCASGFAGSQCAEKAKFTHNIEVNGKNLTVPSYVKDATYVRVVVNGSEKITAIPDDPMQNLTTIVDGEEVPAFVEDDKLMMIPDASSPLFVEAKPLEPVRAGAVSVKLNCEDLSKFSVGSVLVFGAGTANTEIRKVAGVTMPSACALPKQDKHKCPKDCSGHGQCKAGECMCAENYGGAACDSWVCLENDCNHGTCNVTRGKCICEPGYAGMKCDLKTGKNATKAAAAMKFVASSAALVSNNAPAPKARVRVTCMNPGKPVTLMADATAASISYSICEFFCADPATPTVPFQGPCQVGNKRFSAGGAMVVDVASTGMSLVEVEGSDEGLKLNMPLKFAHNGPMVKAVQAGAPLPVPELDPGKDCGKATIAGSGNCFGNGMCNRKNGVCACSDGWAPPFCQLSTCPSTCHKKGGKCEWNAAKSKKVCKCAFGFGGAFCDEQLCPVVPGEGMCGGKYRGSCVANATATNVNSTWTPASCVCKEGMGGVDCMKAGGCGGSGHECGSNGQCVAGSCMCSPGWGGVSCNKQVCPNNCTGAEFGTCAVVSTGVDKRHARQCVCKMGHKGRDCSLDDPCAQAHGGACSGHGKCSSNSVSDGGRHCLCEQGWDGEFCEGRSKRTCPITNDGKFCGGEDRGSCVNTTVLEENCLSPPCCQCKYGYFGHDCTGNAPCPGENGQCNKKGHCKGGVCECFNGWTGNACQQQAVCPFYGSKECAGHGECIIGVCQCEEGWVGASCSKAKGCPNNCTSPDHGRCAGTHCACMPGWSGADCSFSTKVKCPEGCNGHGICQVSTAKCYCEPGFEGPTCSESVGCPVFENKTCSGWGVCKYGRCFCAPGREQSPDCRAPQECPRDDSGNLCSGAGLCLNGTCFCAPGHYGDTCQRGKQCKNDCSRNGFCHNGKCQCDIAWYGDDCSIPVRCKGEIKDTTDNSTMTCAGHGRCLRGRCYCGPGWMGDDCATSMPCPAGCGPNGRCEGSVCICQPGWTGANCTEQVACQPANCSGNGQCLLGQCQCREGWAGASCDQAVPCPNDCNNHGDCVNGKCVCNFDYFGVDCSEGGRLKVELFGPRCPKNCSGNGICDAGSCLCNLEWTGADCSERRYCPNNCSAHGMCHNGNCFCDPGYNGTSCSIYSGCLPGGNVPDCNDHGMCSHGRCFCQPGWSGDACDKNPEKEASEKCVERNGLPCAGHGICDHGKCICEKGWYGAACDSVVKTIDAQQAVSKKKVDGLNAFSFREQRVSLVTSNKKSTLKAMGKIAAKASVKVAVAATSNAETACSKKCNKQRGTCAKRVNAATSLEEEYCKCKVGSLWVNGEDKDSCDTEECPNRCGMGADGVANGLCVDGTCKCDAGFGGTDCAHECPNRCSGHGRCMGNRNDQASFHCFCESPWTGTSCSEAAHANMVVSSMVAVAILTFVIGLCCIPLMKEYMEKREKEKYLNIVRGEGAIPTQPMRVQ